jgi:hypothetical protein
MFTFLALATHTHTHATDTPVTIRFSPGPCMCSKFVRKCFNEAVSIAQRVHSQLLLLVFFDTAIAFVIAVSSSKVCRN